MTMENEKVACGNSVDTRIEANGKTLSFAIKRKLKAFDSEMPFCVDACYY